MMASIRPLTPELAEKARVELNEDPKTLKDDLQHLKDWIAKQPHLRARTDDQWLTSFLRGCKFSLEKTKVKIDLYYSLRSTAPEFHRIKYSDPKFFEILELGSFIVLPETVGVNPTVTIISPGRYSADKYRITDIMSVAYKLQKIMIMDNDNAVVVGDQIILDLQNVTFGHFLQMTPGTLKRIAVATQDAMPFRMKGVHFLNTPLGFETLFFAIKALLNEKNRERLYVHNKNYEEMYNYIPKYILPEEYGGNGGTMKDIKEYWKKEVQKRSAWLEEDEQYGTDESKRPGKPNTANDMFRVEGSFRQLECD